MVGRAFVRGDLGAARDGLSRALAADLPTDDLVYVALWVRLLERQARVPSDGTAARVLTTVPDDGRWIARIAQFGAGRIKGDDLVAAAKTPTQRTEATFYSAIEKRIAGDAKASEDGLRRVLQSPALDLMEMAFARDLLEGPKAQVGGPLPRDVQVP
jgi:hypothetical protein